MGEARRRNKRTIPIRKITKVFVRVMIFAVCVLAALDFIARRNASVFDNADPLRAFGPEEASLRIVQFIDFQNPECGRGGKVLDAYAKKHKDDMWIMTRYFHTPDRNSLISAIHAECAARQGLFWPYYDQLLVKQHQWRVLAEAGPYLSLLARNINADMKMFSACVGDIEVKQVVEEETRLGHSHGMHTAPTYFVNDDKLVGPDELDKYLAEYFENKRLGFL